LSTIHNKPSRIVVVGAGSVGSTTAYTLLLRQRVEELVLIDVRREKAAGDAMDFNHGLPFLGRTKVWAGDYPDCAEADIVIVTAGVAQRPGESRQDLLDRNAQIIREVVENVARYSKDAILLMATNPVDVLSYFAWKVSGWPAQRVIGSGTVLDSARLRYHIGAALDIDPRNIHAHIIGEHGDTELPVWSRAQVAGVQIPLEEAEREAIFQRTRNAAYEIIQSKGMTNYAIALALERICTAILRNEGTVLTVSTLLQDYCGVSDVYLGVPCVVDRSGVRDVIKLELDDKERAQFQASADAIRERIHSLGL
jgi:L-lactate dehydrogenase